MSDAEEGGVVRFVVILVLSSEEGCMEVDGEKGNGESEAEAEDSEGVVLSERDGCGGRRMAEDGRGIAIAEVEGAAGMGTALV